MLYRIGEVSKICNIPIKTLRYYDEIGLLEPSKINEESGYRYYSKNQLALILVIKFFKNAGFSLKEIKKLLGRENFDYNVEKIKEKCSEIDNKINDLLRLKSKLQFCVDESSDKDVKNESKIKEEYIPVSYVAYMRSKSSVSIDEFTVRYCKLMSMIEKNNFHITKNVMAVYYDNCIAFEHEDKNDYDIEVCAVVSEKKEIPGLVRKFGGFKALTAVHYGDYDKLIDLYKKMYSYAQENNYTICGPVVDNYLIDIISTSNPDNYVTQLIVPIK